MSPSALRIILVRLWDLFWRPIRGAARGIPAPAWPAVEARAVGCVVGVVWALCEVALGAVLPASPVLPVLPAALLLVGVAPEVFLVLVAGVFAAGVFVAGVFVAGVLILAVVVLSAELLSVAVDLLPPALFSVVALLLLVGLVTVMLFLAVPLVRPEPELWPEVWAT